MAGFKTIIILHFAHLIYDSWNVFSSKIWLVKTSTRIMIYESWIFKSHPVLLSMLMILLFLRKKSSFKILGVTSSSKIDWGTYIISIAKIFSKNTGALIHSIKFLSPEVVLYLFFNWYSLHARLNSHRKAWKYKKRKHKKIKPYRKWLVHFCYWCENRWVCFWGKIF